MQKGKRYITFTLYIPVKKVGLDGKEAEIKKYCTLWIFEGDVREKHVVLYQFSCWQNFVVFSLYRLTVL
ncbi:hypothetical protein ATZ36_08730 [Candidatus Endomicrobiellum trichonymphae]|uniref:Uncharacterized protein n=1 Tax=Endomicrobium trichonymphae TaxID=1408204 RepID=A0A1E5IGN4_ENDTX|nr:hypothetical protein ATZ36_08730 [Candidatus Endomicrobium trichonymphae]